MEKWQKTRMDAGARILRAMEKMNRNMAASGDRQLITAHPWGGEVQNRGMLRQGAEDLPFLISS